MKNKLNKKTIFFLKGFLSGFLIGLAGFIYFGSGAGKFGAALFTLALFFIVLFESFLFTGKVGFTYELSKKDVLKIPLIFLSNMLGAIVIAGITTTLVGDNHIDTIRTTRLLVKGMASDCVVNFLLKGFICGIIIHLSIEGYNMSDNPLFKFMSLLLPIVSFVLVKAEHSVANTYYYFLCIFRGHFDVHMITSIIVLFFMNAFGGIFMRFLVKDIIESIILKKKSNK